MRFCEDRRLIYQSHLKELFEERTEAVGTNTIVFLKENFKDYDNIFNSDLFKLQLWEDNLAIDFKVIRDIVSESYLYQFDVIPVEILGNIYEQYLGYTLRLTDHKVKYELKPELLKAHGVYYTPEYIVDYIVKNTVDKLLQELPPNRIKKLRILDPACGSGSFLIRAYEEMLNYYRNQKRQRRKLVEGQEKLDLKQEKLEPHLTMQEKSEILRNHIFGVDIDKQAVEVTKLSLMLKMLEGEYGIIPGRAILPMLDKNIKCGNSLISGNSSELKKYFGDVLSKVKPFNWDEEFRKIMKEEGGFDAIIGNPPYLYSAGQTYFDYFSHNYRLYQYQTDFYVFFIERALTLARLRGKVSFIVSDSWLNSEYFSKLRNHLLTKHKIDVLAVFDYTAFANVTLENSIFVVTVSEKPSVVSIVRFSEPNVYSTINRIDPSEAVERGLIDPRRSSVSERVLVSIERNTQRLDRYVKLNRGIHAYRTDGYGKSKFGLGPQTKRDKEVCSYHADNPLDNTYLPELKGKDIGRFAFTPSGKFLSYGSWLAEPRSPEFFFNPKITLRKILGPKLHGAFIKEPFALDQSLYILISKNNDLSELKYLLGILLSRLGVWYLRTKHAIYDVLYPWYTKKQLAAFPVKEKNHRNLVALVDVMLGLNKKLMTAKGNEREKIQRQIEKTDREIDEMVYKLYGITEKERNIIDGKT